MVIRLASVPPAQQVLLIFLVDPNHPLSSLSWSLWICKNGPVSSTCKEEGWLNPFSKSLPLILEQKLGRGAQGKGTSHDSFSLKGIPCGNALLSPETCPNVPLKKKDCIQQMPNMSLAKKNRFKNKQTKSYKLITNCLVWFVNFYSFCNPFQSAWARFMVVTIPGLAEFSWLGYLSPLHLFVSTQWSAQQWGCWQVMICATELYKSMENKTGTTISGAIKATSISHNGEWLLGNKIYLNFCFKNFFDWLLHSLALFYDGGILQKKQVSVVLR